MLDHTAAAIAVTAGFAAVHVPAQGRLAAVHVVTGGGFSALALGPGLPAAMTAHAVYNALVAATLTTPQHCPVRTVPFGGTPPYARRTTRAPTPAPGSGAEAAPSLRLEDVARRFGAVVALDGVSLELRPGEIVTLLGPNGAGKSTLVKIAVGLVQASGGEATVGGAPAGSRAARASLGYLAELFRFPGWYSADEVLRLHQRLAGSHGGEPERAELLGLVGLAEARGRKVDAMSKGMQQRLGIAQALVGSPRLLLLDEPTSALDPAGRRTVRRLLEELRGRGVAVLLNSHLLSEVELVCDRVVIISRGSVVAAGTPDELSHARGVEVETAAGPREFPDASREDAPRIVAELVAAGERIYEVRVRQTTLEETYLSAVGEDAT